MNALHDVGRKLIDFATGRPKAAAALALLAPPMLALTVKGMSSDDPLVEATPSRDQIAAGDAYLLAQIDLLRDQLAEQSREVAGLQLALERVETEHSSVIPSSVETGAFRASPTETGYLRRKPALVDLSPVVQSLGGSAPAKNRSPRPTTVLLGDRSSSAAPLLPATQGGPLPTPPPPSGPGPQLPAPPHGAPEIDPNLATAGVLLLVGGTLALTGRRRAV